MNKRIKRTLGSIPYSAEVFWWLRRSGKPPVSGYSLADLQTQLPVWVDQAGKLIQPSNGKKVLIFSMLPYWIEQTSMLSLALAILGYDVSLAYLPYAHWKKEVERFDARRQNAYMREALKPLEKFVKLIPLLDSPGESILPVEIENQLPAATDRK